MRAPLADACACVAKGCACAPVRVISPGYEDPRYPKSRGVVQLHPSSAAKARVARAAKGVAGAEPGALCRARVELSLGALRYDAKARRWEDVGAKGTPRVVGPGDASPVTLGALREAFEDEALALRMGASYAQAPRGR